MGAWIETGTSLSTMKYEWSHPTWVRGLKLKLIATIAVAVASHPTWVRGLKRRKILPHLCTVGSHPTWVRGLKPVSQ